MSDRPFQEKRDMVGGFADSPIRLNRMLAHLQHWNEDEIIKRARHLAKIATNIWPAPRLSENVTARYVIAPGTAQRWVELVSAATVSSHVPGGHL